MCRRVRERLLFLCRDPLPPKLTTGREIASGRRLKQSQKVKKFSLFDFSGLFVFLVTFRRFVFLVTFRRFVFLVTFRLFVFLVTFRLFGTFRLFAFFLSFSGCACAQPLAITESLPRPEDLRRSTSIDGVPRVRAGIRVYRWN